MSYEVVARRWRPQTFESVVGQRHVTAILEAAIESDRVAHAFLFTGIRGVGKTTVARILARALNCAKREGAEPCNQCPSCEQVLSGASVDVIEIDGASNNGIEEVRALIEASQYRPATGKYRIYIIDEVHQLSKPAFNALLKTLEEPPEHVKFILATTEVHKVLETVLSRCQRYDFRRLSVKEIVGQLSHIVERDELAVSAEALALIAREADGSMRDAQSLLEQLAAATGGRADVADVTLTLGVAPTEVLTGIVEAILKRDGTTVVELSRQVRDAGHDPERVLHEVIDLVRHVCVAAAAGPKALDDSVADALRESAIALKDERHPLDVHRIFDSLLRSAEDLRHGAMADIVFEMGLLKAAALESVLSSGEILAMLEGAPAPKKTGGAQARERGARAAAPARQPGAAGGRDAKRDTRPAAPAAPQRRPAAEQAAAAPDAAADELPPHPAEDASADVVGPGPAWKSFLDTAATAGGISVSVALGNCELVALDDKRVVIRPMTAVARKPLETPETLVKLRELVHEHFGKDVELEIAGGVDTPAASGTGISSHSLEEERRERMEREALDDPLVKGALDLFGGRVRKVSSLED